MDKDCMTLARLCSQAVDYPKNGIPVEKYVCNPPLHSLDANLSAKKQNTSTTHACETRLEEGRAECSP